MESESSIEDQDKPQKVLILFASETGNAQNTAERVGREIKRRGGRCTVESMQDFDIVCRSIGSAVHALVADALRHSSQAQVDLPHIPLLILITSTHGRGDPPPAMLPLWSALLRSGLPEDILEGQLLPAFSSA